MVPFRERHESEFCMESGICIKKQLSLLTKEGVGTHSPCPRHYLLRKDAHITSAVESVTLYTR